MSYFCVMIYPKKAAAYLITFLILLSTTNSLNAQCGSNVSLSYGGNACAGDTLYINGSYGMTEAIWYNNGAVVKTSSTLGPDTIGRCIAGGRYGSYSDRLKNPHGIAFDRQGNIYVADMYNDRIQKFPPNSVQGTSAVTVAGGMGAGSALNQLNDPTDVFIDSLGFMYVSDRNNDRILKFPPNSTQGTNGVIVAAATEPICVFVSDSGYIYTIESFAASSVVRFPINSTADSVSTIVAGLGGTSSSNIAQPRDVVLDKNGNMFVADWAMHRIQKFPPNSVRGTPATTLYHSSWSYPKSVAVDELGNVFAALSGTVTVIKLAQHPNTDTIIVAGGNGGGNGLDQLNDPSSILVDQNGYIYIADQGNHRIQKWFTGGLSPYYVAPSSGNFSVQLSGPSPCVSSSTTNTVAIDSITNVSLRISSTTDSILCGRSSTVSITATITPSHLAGGNIQWKLNGQNIGLNSTSLSASNFADGDKVWAEYIPSIPCGKPEKAYSDTITFAYQPIEKNILAQICSGDSYNFNGTYISLGGNYIDTLITPQGCDSIVNLELEVRSEIAIRYDPILCVGDTFWVNASSYYSRGGTYHDTIVGQLCDSVITTNLIMQSNPRPIIQRTGSTLSTSNSAASYQWFHNGAAITNSNSYQITVIADGIYSVQATQANGCIATSQNFTVNNNVGIQENAIDLGISLYPNPSKGVYQISINNNKVWDLSVFNLTGQSLLVERSISNNYLLNIMELPIGIYYCRLQSNESIATIKIVKY